MKDGEDILAKVREQAEQDRREDDAAKQALTEPLPGPLRDAFALQPDISVGRWSVRPFYDIDYEFLAALNHPMHRMMKEQVAGGNPTEDFFPRGKSAWELAWIMTRDPDTVEAALKDKTLEDKAKKEFGRCQIAALQAITVAVVKQISVYWSPAIGYGPAEQKKEGGEASDAPENPSTTSSAPALTVLGG